VVYAILPAKVAEQLDGWGEAASAGETAARAASTQNNALLFFKLNPPFCRTETVISFFGLSWFEQ